MVQGCLQQYILSADSTRLDIIRCLNEIGYQISDGTKISQISAYLAGESVTVQEEDYTGNSENVCEYELDGIYAKVMEMDASRMKIIDCLVELGRWDGTGYCKLSQIPQHIVKNGIITYNTDFPYE